MPEHDAAPAAPAAAADGPAFALQVGSRWPAYDGHDLIRITLTLRGLDEGFPTRDFQPSALARHNGAGKRLSFGCGYATLAGTDTPCTFGVQLEPHQYQLFPCTRVKKICLKHNHQHDLAPALLEMCKKSDKLDLDERITDVRHRAMEELTRLRRALDFRHSSLDPLEEWFLEKSINEQEFIVKSWDLIPDDQIRADLLEKSQQILIRRERYPILPPLPRAISSNSRPVPPKTSPSTLIRTSRAPTPEPERKVKRVAPPTPEATPARKNARREIVRSPSVEMLAAPHAARSMAHVEDSPIRQARQVSSHRATPQAVAPVAVIDLCDSSDEDVKPDLSAPARLPRPIPPADGSANALLSQNPAPLSPATPAAPTRSSNLADFLSSLEPDRHLERYLALFGRSNLEIDDPRQLLSIARGPQEELDELVAELGKEVDGLKGMPTFWQRIFRRLLIAAADDGGRRVAEL